MVEFFSIDFPLQNKVATIGVGSQQDLLALINMKNAAFFSNAAHIEIKSDRKATSEFYGGLFSRKLTLSFSDSQNETGPKAFKPEQADRIAEFVQSLDPSIDTIIISCTMGQSRSAGIAAALLVYFGGDDSQIWNNPKYSPNQLCYRLLLEEL